MLGRVEYRINQLSIIIEFHKNIVRFLLTPYYKVSNYSLVINKHLIHKLQVILKHGTKNTHFSGEDIIIKLTTLWTIIIRKLYGKRALALKQ